MVRSHGELPTCPKPGTSWTTLRSTRADGSQSWRAPNLPQTRYVMDHPPVYQSRWFAVMESSQLAPNQVRHGPPSGLPEQMVRSHGELPTCPKPGTSGTTLRSTRADGSQSWRAPNLPQTRYVRDHPPVYQSR